jgi:hypothetical protein
LTNHLNNLAGKSFHISAHQNKNFASHGGEKARKKKSVFLGVLAITWNMLEGVFFVGQ